MPVALEDTNEDLKHKFQFTHGIRFEIFYALMAVADREHGIHIPWQREALSRLPSGFIDQMGQVGGSPYFWPVMADVLEASPPELTYTEIRERILALPPERFQTAILEGGLHEVSLVTDLIAGRRSLAEVAEDLSEREERWFGFLGLYPFDPSSPTPAALKRLIEDPDALRADLVDLLDTFWSRVFEDTWSAIEPRVQLSVAEKRRLFDVLPPSEFARQVLIRVEIDDDSFEISCSCMGTVPLNRVAQIYVMPSVFNENRLWSIYADKSMLTMCIPYFDPAISVVLDRPAAAIEPNLSPPQVFKALGEPTRYEMARLIAQKPRTSADLARLLKVSKPTVSHHVQLLRGAGLIGEETGGTGVRLSLRKEIIAQLSDAALNDLTFAETKKAPATSISGSPKI